MKNWYVLFTGYENSLATMKRLVKTCLPKGCGAYIPITTKSNKNRPTRVYSQSLYPFYLFICCTDEKQLYVLEKKMHQLNIDGYFLENTDGKIVPLSADEVRALVSVEFDDQKKPIADEKINGFSSGDFITVIDGPFKGYTSRIAYVTEEYAYISMLTKKKKIAIEVPMLYSDIKKL